MQNETLNGPTGQEDYLFLENISASFELLEQRPPSTALHFERASVGDALRVDARVLNPFTRETLEVSNIVFENRRDGRPPDRAYWIGRKLKTAIYGCVRACTVLRFRNDATMPWQTTEERAVVKVLAWERIQKLRHAEDPIKEVNAMRFLSQYGTHPNVVSALDVLQDEEYLLIFMPFFSSGSLYEFVFRAGVFPEKIARYWFRQILQGLTHLQRHGVCHRDISLENIVVDGYKKCAIIDLGMCLRIPYHDESTGNATDVQHGSLRRLLLPSGACGKISYIAPEILQNKLPFDGFAIDLWGAAIILFIMLVGQPPWPLASYESPNYQMVVSSPLKQEQGYSGNQTGIKQLVSLFGRDISSLAADLLHKMLRHEPRERLSLYDVLSHEWVRGEGQCGQTTDIQDEWRQI